MNFLIVFLNQPKKDQTVSNFITSVGMILFWGSIFTFLVGLLLLFFKNQKENAVKILTYSIIAFIIGFGVCAIGLGISYN